MVGPLFYGLLLAPFGLDPREQDNLAGRGEEKETELQAWLEGMMRELKPGGRP